MNILSQEKYHVSKLYVYHIPDAKIEEHWGSTENFEKKLEKDSPEAILWLNEVMPTITGIGKTYSDCVESKPQVVWEKLVMKGKEK